MFFPTFSGLKDKLWILKYLYNWHKLCCCFLIYKSTHDWWITPSAFINVCQAHGGKWYPSEGMSRGVLTVTSQSYQGNEDWEPSNDFEIREGQGTQEVTQEVSPAPKERRNQLLAQPAPRVQIKADSWNLFQFPRSVLFIVPWSHTWVWAASDAGWGLTQL